MINRIGMGYGTVGFVAGKKPPVKKVVDRAKNVMENKKPKTMSWDILNKLFEEWDASPENRTLSALKDFGKKHNVRIHE